MATAEPALKTSTSAKLKELADKRVPAAVEKIRLIGNLGNYKPNPFEVNKIMTALRNACKKAEDRLRGSVPAEETDFSL